MLLSSSSFFPSCFFSFPPPLLSFLLFSFVSPRSRGPALTSRYTPRRGQKPRLVSFYAFWPFSRFVCFPSSTGCVCVKLFNLCVWMCWLFLLSLSLGCHPFHLLVFIKVHTHIHTRPDPSVKVKSYTHNPHKNRKATGPPPPPKSRHVYLCYLCCLHLLSSKCLFVRFRSPLQGTHGGITHAHRLTHSRMHACTLFCCCSKFFKKSCTQLLLLCLKKASQARLISFLSRPFTKRNAHARGRSGLIGRWWRRRQQWMSSKESHLLTFSFLAGFSTPLLCSTTTASPTATTLLFVDDQKHTYHFLHDDNVPND